MTSAPLIDGFTVRRLEDEDVGPLQALFDEDPEYFEINGRPIPVKEICNALPPGRARDDKFLYTLNKDDRVAGMIDVVRGYPAPTTWYLGFLFLSKAARSGGAGRRALHGLYAWSKGQGATAMRLGVVEGNARARHLYATEGFAVREPDPAVNRVRRTLVLERPL